jgi:hypothetical protein
LAEHIARIEERIGVCRVWWGNLAERGHLEKPVMDGRILLRWIFSKCDEECLDWIGLAQNRDRWRALVNEVKQF